MTAFYAPDGALDAGLALAAALEEAGVSYALGGALALGVWSVPRGTVDVDVNAFVDAGDVAAVVAALSPRGCSRSRGAGGRAAEMPATEVVLYGRQVAALGELERAALESLAAAAGENHAGDEALLGTLRDRALTG